MATPGQMAKKAAKQTTDILGAIQGLVNEVAELKAEIAELKDALTKPPARRVKK